AKHVLTGSLDDTAILWDADSGKKLHTFQGHTIWGMNVALSGDGKVAVTGDEKPGFLGRSVFSAILWSTASCEKLHTIRGGAAPMRCAALSDDGKHILTGSDDNTAIHSWEADGLKRLQTFGRHGANCVALSGDGKHAVTGSGTAILWETASGKQLQTFEGHTNVVTSVALSGDAKHVLTGFSDNTAILWDAASGKKLHTFQGHTNSVWEVALSRDGKQAWTVSFDGTLRIWDVATGKERCRLYSCDAGKDWLIVTPEGLFDGSEGAARLVVYRVPGAQKLVDDDATRRRFHRPGLLSKVWQAE